MRTIIQGYKDLDKLDGSWSGATVNKDLGDNTRLMRTCYATATIEVAHANTPRRISSPAWLGHLGTIGGSQQRAVVPQVDVKLEFGLQLPVEL